MGIVIENTSLCGSETHFPLEKIIRSRKKEKEAPGLVLHQKPAKRLESTFICRPTVADLSHFSCEHSCWLLLSQAGINTEHSHSCTLLQHVLTKKKKVNVLNVLKDSPCLSLKFSTLVKSSTTVAVPVKSMEEGVPVEVEVNVCEEAKKECISMWFHDIISYLYFPPDYLRMHFLNIFRGKNSMAFGVFPLK